MNIKLFSIQGVPRYRIILYEHIFETIRPMCFMFWYRGVPQAIKYFDIKSRPGNTAFCRNTHLRNQKEQKVEIWFTGVFQTMLLVGSTKVDVATPQNISSNNFGTESRTEMRIVSLSTVGERLSIPNVKKNKYVKLATPQFSNAYIS